MACQQAKEQRKVEAEQHRKRNVEATEQRKKKLLVHVNLVVITDAYDRLALPPYQQLEAWPNLLSGMRAFVLDPTAISDVLELVTTACTKRCCQATHHLQG